MVKETVFNLVERFERYELLVEYQQYLTGFTHRMEQVPEPMKQAIETVLAKIEAPDREVDNATLLRELTEFLFQKSDFEHDQRELELLYAKLEAFRDLFQADHSCNRRLKPNPMLSDDLHDLFDQHVDPLIESVFVSITKPQESA